MFAPTTIFGAGWAFVWAISAAVMMLDAKAIQPKTNAKTKVDIEKYCLLSIFVPLYSPARRSLAFELPGDTSQSQGPVAERVQLLIQQPGHPFLRLFRK